MRKLTRIESLFDEAPAEVSDLVPHEFPLPALEQRINLYLMGVHGPRPYSSEERATAREFIVGEISSNLFGLAGKGADESQRLPDGPGVDPVAYSSKWRPLTDHLLLEEDALFSVARIQDLAPRSEALRPMLRRLDQPTAKIDESALISRLEAALNTKTGQSTEDVSPPSGLRVPEQKASFSELLGQIGQESVPPKSPRRWRSIGAATFIGCLIGTLATGSYHWLRSTEEPSSNVVAKLARSPTDTMQRAEIQDLNLEMSWRFIRIAEDLIEARNVAGARAVLVEAAQIGSASAALTLGATYDPSEIVNDYRQRRDQANIQEARRWYQRAKELGSNAAQERLDRLGADR